MDKIDFQINKDPQQVNLTGGKLWYSEFEAPDGIRFKVRITEDEYRVLGEAGASSPTHKGGTWVMSGETLEYDTVDGFIHPGEFAVSEDGLKKNICLDGGFVATISKDAESVEKISAVESDRVFELIKTL